MYLLLRAGVSLTEQGFDTSEGLPMALADWLIAIDLTTRAGQAQREAEQSAAMFGGT